MNNLPKVIQHHIKNKPFTENHVGMTDSKIYMFDSMVLKIEQTTEESNNEYRMLSWLQGKLPVPRIIQFTQENGYNYLLTTRIEGYMAFEETIMSNPKEMIHLLAEGLKMLWSVNIEECPYVNDLSKKLADAQENIKHNRVDYNEMDEDTLHRFGREAQHLLDYLVAHKPVEDFVFSHGDYCLPNVLFKDGHIQAFIDLGRAGIADRYQDIALCVRSIKYNMSEDFQDQYIIQLFNELDLAYDQEKVDYYILLDELF